MKLLTVAMPCFNVEAYIERGLSSLADSRMSDDLEVLIINDGSTDRTAALAQGFVDRHPNIFRLITKENGGHGSGINTGLKHAAGAYFRIIDGDDWVHTENLVRLIDCLRHTRADIIVDTKRNVDMVTGASKSFLLPDYVETNRAYRFDEICNRQDIESYISIHTLTTKTQLLREKGIHILEGIFYVDYEYIVKATCFAKTVCFLQLEIYQYLTGNADQSVAVENYVKRYEHHKKMIEELLRFSENTSVALPIRTYIDHKIRLAIHTHYNILLVFDTDRKHGMQRAKEFRAWLHTAYPRFATSTDKRFKQARLLHYLGIDSRKLERIMGRA